MIAILCSLMVTVAALASLPPPPIAWSHDYAVSLAECQRSGRPMLCYFTGKGCLWCVKLDAALWPNEAARRAVHEGRFVTVKLDADKEKRLARDLWVRRRPTMILAAPDGTILSFDEGFVEPITFSLRLKRAVADVAALEAANR